VKLKVSKAVAEFIIDRARGRCERCRAKRGQEIHHRQPRGMGGTRDPKLNMPENLVFLCGDCHRWCESHRNEARDTGWLVPRPTDPATVTPIPL
jgi:5-methylcytosine-specific restriction protein A